MSSNWKNNKLPFLPGYTFQDVTKSAFHRPQTLVYNNGCAVPHRPTVGIGQEPLISEQLIQQELSNLTFETPVMDDIRGTESNFVPSYVAFDKKVLGFHGYFTEDVQYPPAEKFRVRSVTIQYFLEDDTMIVYEPAVENSGLQQGKRLKRQRLPKNNGEYYLWTDLNIGVDLEILGVRYHITQCDAFTKEFLESQGIIVNDPEEIPVDLYIQSRKIPKQCFITRPKHKNKFFTMNNMVLRFFALLVDMDSLEGEFRPVVIKYYLENDSVEIKEIPQPNSGRGNHTFLLRRQKVPKKIKPGSFPSCVMEISDNEVDEYYSPEDFIVGQNMTLLGRHLKLYDCDGFTKDYYQQNYPDMEMKPVPTKDRTNFSFSCGCDNISQNSANTSPEFQ